LGKGEKEAEGRYGRESMRTEIYRQAGRQTDRQTKIGKKREIWWEKDRNRE